MFLSAFSPRSTNASFTLSRTCRQASSERQIAPGSAIPSNRAAMLTPSPRRSPSLVLDHVAEMDADPKFDALVRRDPGVALDHRPLDFNGAVHRVHDAAELDNRAVPGALDDAPVVHGDGRIDEIASE